MVARLVRDQEGAGSNPVSPIMKNLVSIRLARFFDLSENERAAAFSDYLVTTLIKIAKMSLLLNRANSLYEKNKRLF